MLRFVPVSIEERDEDVAWLLSHVSDATARHMLPDAGTDGGEQSWQSCWVYGKLSEVRETCFFL